MEFYCMKCRKKVEASIKNEKETKRGTIIALSRCPECGTKVAKILGKKKE